MTNRGIRISVVLVVVLGLGVGGAWWVDAGQATEDPAGGQTAEKRFDSTKLQKFYDDREMTSQQRLDGLLGYLKEEIGSPTPPALGIGGGPIDSGYVQGAIVGVMGWTVAAADLVAARTQETNPALQERLTVALGIAGDKSMIPHLIPILAHHPEGFLRQTAAIALADFKESSLKPAFNGALNDRYSRVGISCLGGGGICKMYPVREAAARGLRLLGEEVSPDLYIDARRASHVTEAISWLLEDKDPGVCLSAVKMLGKYGEAGIPYLGEFAERNRSDPTLKAAVKAAQDIVARSSRTPARANPSTPSASTMRT